jgi:hypothetical protein
MIQSGLGSTRGMQLVQEGLLEYAQKTRCPDGRNPVSSHSCFECEGWVGCRELLSEGGIWGAFGGVDVWRGGRCEGGMGWRRGGWFWKCGVGKEGATELIWGAIPSEEF